MADLKNTNQLLDRIGAEFDELPRQLQRIARYLEQNRNVLVVQRISDVAKGAGVHPSAVVRFAQYFGFVGFRELQKFFRDEYTDQIAPAQSYQQRVRAAIEQAEPSATRSASDIARQFLDASRLGLDELIGNFDAERFGAAVDLLLGARNIYIVGVRRSFPSATYLAYALQHTRRQVSLISGIGGMFHEQINGISRGDVLVGISFLPYGKEAIYCARLAREREARVLAISDSELSPLGQRADVLLKVFEGSAFAFRSLTSTICLCQALSIAMVYRLELEVDESARRDGYE